MRRMLSTQTRSAAIDLAEGGFYSWSSGAHGGGDELHFASAKAPKHF